MFYIKGNTLLTSDWHIYHKNIWIYEFNKRKKFFPENLQYLQSGEELKELYNSLLSENKKQEVIDIYLEAEYNMLNSIFEELTNILENNKIVKYYDLGDFLCFPSYQKVREYKITSNYKIIEKIFTLLKSYNIETTLFLGNHDDIKIINFYNLLFDNTKTFDFEEGILYSHEPFNENGKNFGLNKTSIKINYHGHVHSNIAYEVEIFKNIKYINVCFDNLI